MKVAKTDLAASAIALLLFTALPCKAQLMNTGTITGSAVDQTSTAVPDADVTLTNTGTGTTVRTKSNANGGFSSVGLAAGRYDVAVSRSGFATYKETGILLEPAAVYTVNAILKPSAVTEEVTVSASAERVQTDTPEV